MRWPRSHCSWYLLDARQLNNYKRLPCHKPIIAYHAGGRPRVKLSESIRVPRNIIKVERPSNLLGATCTGKPSMQLLMHRAELRACAQPGDPLGYRRNHLDNVWNW